MVCFFLFCDDIFDFLVGGYMEVVGRYIPTENLIEGKETVLISKGVK